MVARIRRSAVLVALGLGCLLVAALHWTPATFIFAAVVGGPLVVAGSLTFLAAVLRNIEDKGAL
jgi:hypothetical protein